MKQLIYVSRVAPHVTFDEVQKILTIAVAKNREFNITGMMLYSHDYFLQCIEGDEERILQLLANLKKDRRHYDIKVYDIRDVDERSFEDWNSGFLSYSRAIHAIIAKTTKQELFMPYELSYIEARELLKELSKVI